VFFWHLLLLEQMTKEVLGIRPAVISTETGTRLDAYRRFRYVVRNPYTHNFGPAKLGKLVNSAPELFPRTKVELLTLPFFSNTSRDGRVRGIGIVAHDSIGNDRPRNLSPECQ
jgi:hypothetical protein